MIQDYIEEFEFGDKGNKFIVFVSMLKGFVIIFVLVGGSLILFLI